MLNAFIENSDKTRSYLNQANRCKIDILPPDVNLSGAKFIGSPGSIRFGLSGINGIKSVADAIVSERERNGAYADLQDLYERLARAGEGMTKKSAEGLVYSGALSSFSTNKAALYKQYELIEEDYKRNAENRALEQFSMFSTDELKVACPDVTPISEDEALKREYSVLGFHLSGHPTDKILANLVPPPGYISLSTLATIENSSKKTSLVTIGLIKKLKTFYTKNGDEMCSFDLETKFASVPAVVFSREMAANKANLMENTVMAVWGDYVYDERHEKMQLIVSKVLDPKAFTAQASAPVVIQIRSKEEQREVLEYIKAHKGNTPVSLEYAGKQYPLKSGINYNAAAINFLQTLENRRIS